MKRRIAMGIGAFWLLSLSCGNDSKSGDTVTCTDEDLALGCHAGACTLSAPRGTLGSDRKLTLSRIPVPAELTGDAIGDSVCTMTLPADRENAADFNLTIAQPDDAKPDSALFEHVTTGDPDALIVASHAGTRSIGGLVRHSGTYGATRRPGPWGIDAIAGIDASGSSDAASLLRNISSKPIGAAFYDGTRLYVGSGNRLLIWNQMPKDSLVKPDVVLGQPDLDSNIQTTSSAIWRGGVNGIWSDGVKLIAACSNRVLVWSNVPTVSGTPADLVLGQPDFGTDTANTGGVSAESMSEPWAVDSDGTRLIVSDMRNNRVLAWSAFPTTIDQAATGVIGQTTFTTNGANAGATQIYQSFGAVLDGGGAFVAGYFQNNVKRISSLGVNPAADFGLFSATTPSVRPDAAYLTGGVARTTSGMVVRETWGSRVAVFATIPGATTAMDFALGQPDPFRAVWNPTSGSSLGQSYTLSAHGDVVLVPDGNRLMIFEKPTFNLEPATRVIGQAGFSTNEVSLDYRGISSRALGGTADVAVSGSTVAAADRGNNRVVLYDTADLATINASAKLVLGQPDATSFKASSGAAGLSGPSGVAVDGTHVVVADTENHRVLIWNKSPTQSGVPADVVLGQPDFTGTRPNHGRLDVNPKDGFSDAGSDGFFSPTGVASDGTHLVVADRSNHRVLVWKAWPTTNGQPADAVIGQPTFTEVRANRGNGPFTVVPNGLNLPLGVTLAQGALWIADTENNRVVRVADPFGAPTPNAFLGQPDGATVTNPNIFGSMEYQAGSPQVSSTTSTSVLRPRGVALTGGRVFVSETTSNRIHIFDAGLAPIGLLGQDSLTSSGPNAGGVGPSSLWMPLGLGSDATFVYVADSKNNRVLRFDAFVVSGAPASDVVGQQSMSASGFDQGGAAKAGATSRPRGMALSNGELFACDADNNRLLVFDSPPTPGANPKRILGQADDVTTLPNSGGPVRAGSLFGPRGVHASSTWIAVADTRNHRVLLFDRAGKSDSAKLVLGQPDFHSNSRNQGSTPSASTLSAPEGVFVDQNAIYVADTGNNRVLVWNHTPTANGEPADFVLGQANVSSLLPNRGGGPSADTLFSPSGIVASRGGLYVADTGNNRLVRWNAIPTSTVPADAVLGQLDFSSRAPAVDSHDVSRLASPTALTTDDTYVYALDRDLGRVVTFTLTSPSTAPGTVVYGPSGGLVLTSPGGVAVERTALFTSRLIVGDTGANRVVVVGSASRLR